LQVLLSYISDMYRFPIYHSHPKCSHWPWWAGRVSSHPSKALLIWWGTTTCTTSPNSCSPGECKW